MVWTIEISAAAEQDIDLLFDHLADSYVGFGESHVAAAAHAVARIDEILNAMERIVAAPYRGEAHDEWFPGLRHLTLDRAIYWYVADKEQQMVRVQAVFYGSQNHIRHMLMRLLGDAQGSGLITRS